MGSEFIVGKKKLGTLLLEQGLLSEEQVRWALDKQKESKKFLGQILTEAGLIEERELLKILALQFETEFVDLESKDFRLTKKIVSIVPFYLMCEFSLIPVKLECQTLWILVSDPFKRQGFEKVEMITGYEIKLVLGLQLQIDNIIKNYANHERKGIADTSLSKITHLQEKRYGEALINMGLINREQLNAAVEIHNSTNRYIGDVLIDQHLISRSDMIASLDSIPRVDFKSLSGFKPDNAIVKMVPPDVMIDHVMVPVSLDDNVLTMAIPNDDAATHNALDVVRIATGCVIKYVLAQKNEIEYALSEEFPDEFGAPPPKISPPEIKKPATSSYYAQPPAQQAAPPPAAVKTPSTPAVEQTQQPIPVPTTVPQGIPQSVPEMAATPQMPSPGVQQVQMPQMQTPPMQGVPAVPQGMAMPVAPGVIPQPMPGGYPSPLPVIKPKPKMQNMSAEDLDALKEASDANAKKLLIEESDQKALNNLATDSMAPEFVSSMLGLSLKYKASDIHLENTPDSLVIRLRIDGILYELAKYPKILSAPTISRFKVLADMDISERFKAQDGNFQEKIGDNNVDFRLCVCPSIFGENAVIRILSQQEVSLDVEKLGFAHDQQLAIKKNLRRSYGMILINGPTGSGKTTTLYSMLQYVKSPSVKIITIEDPVEYRIPGITQMQVHINRNDSTKSFQFSDGLKASLRSDPNIIMVGEVRDASLANIVVQAALTGHLVFTTLHANNAVDVVGRLLNLEVDPQLLAASIKMVVSQRLVKKLCVSCREPVPDAKRFFDIIGEDFSKYQDAIFYRSRGCKKCGFKGFTGRIGVYEILEISENIRQLIFSNASLVQIKQMACAEGMRLITETCMEKVIDGIVGLDEYVSIHFDSE